MEKGRKYLSFAGIFMLLFLILTVAVKLVDVEQIGPLESSVGFAALNGKVSEIFKFNAAWYNITDVLGKLSILVAVFFAVIGVYQLVKRKSIARVDKDLLLLACAYIVSAIAYVFFEVCIINYRPVILEGDLLEASFPSSHTVLVICFVGTALHQFAHRIKDVKLKNISVAICSVIILLMIVGRLVSGVHWFTDILGGILLGCAIVFAYAGMYEKTVHDKRH